mgnify:CR=1 FL=1
MIKMRIRKIKVDNIDDAAKIIASTKCDKYVHTKLAKKILQSSFIIENIDNRAANILKQEALSCGCDVAVSKDVSLFEKGISTVVLCANKYLSEKLALKIKEQPFGLKEVSEKLLKISAGNEKRIILTANGKVVLKDIPLVMGIVNLSEDSFFGNGFDDENKALKAAVDMQEQGADIIDIGAESTKPGSKPVAVKDEILKIKNFLRLARKKIKIPVSIDTYKPEVAEVALCEGADIINDICALRKQCIMYNVQCTTNDNGKNRKKIKKSMADVVAKHKAGVVLMHMLNNPLTMQRNIKYNNDVVSDICDFLQKQTEYAVESGIKKESITAFLKVLKVNGQRMLFHIKTNLY